jgi:plasmid stabilization system protein ParE
MVKWTPKSEDDLEEILAHVSNNFTTDLALTVVEEIINFTESTLFSNPLAGAIFESNPIFYKLIHKGNTIFYCENPKDGNIYIIYVQPRKLT